MASVAALAALLLSAVGLIATAPPASASPGPAVSAPQPAITASTATASSPPRELQRPTAQSTPSAVAPTSTSTPTSTPSSPPPTPRPPVLNALPSGLVRAFPLVVSGSGTSGDVIRVSGGSSPGAAESCQATVGSDGRFSCGLQSLPDGPGVPVRAESATTGASDTDRVDVLRPPVIAAQGVVATGGGVRGTAYPNARVTVTADTGATCTFPADSSGAWGCVLSGTLPDGPHSVTATQVAGFSTQRSASSPRVRIDIDRTAPAAPVITTPASDGSATAGQPVGFGGTGESGAHVTLYATTPQGATVVCTATVAGGAWSCQGTLPDGAYTLSALQRDAAGNVSPGSNSIALAVTGAGASTDPSPSRTPSPTAAPVAPAPAAPVVPPARLPPPDTDDWIATPFSTTSAPVVSSEALPGWMRSVGLAVAAILLLVLPARLLTVSLARGRSERGQRRPVSVFGRNRPRSDVSDASALFGGGLFGGAKASVSGPLAAAAGSGASASAASPGSPGSPGSPAGRPQPLWLAPAVTGAAALLVTLSTPLPDPAAYLRVLLAVVVAVGAVNAIWVLAGRGLAPHLGLPVPRLIVRPGMLVVVAVAAIGSRLLGLSPALLFALVLGLSMGPHAGRVRRGRIAAVQVSAVAALGVLAWLAVGLVGTPTGVFSAFLLELANALALVGIGSAAVMLLPLGGLAGRAIARWSRWLWAGLSLVVYTVLFALLLPVASLMQRGVGAVVIIGAVLCFAAASVAVWLWERYVAPALDRTVP